MCACVCVCARSVSWLHAEVSTLQFYKEHLLSDFSDTVARSELKAPSTLFFLGIWVVCDFWCTKMAYHFRQKGCNFWKRTASGPCAYNLLIYSGFNSLALQSFWSDWINIWCIALAILTLQPQLFRADARLSPKVTGSHRPTSQWGNRVRRWMLGSLRPWSCANHHMGRELLPVQAWWIWDQST